MEKTPHIPRLVVLELTRRCNLSCIHCRASSQRDAGEGELSTEEWLGVLDDISLFYKPIIILSGGEALLRDDVFEIISHAGQRGLTVVLATCGAALTLEKVAKLKSAGIKRVSVSIDGKDAATHDFIRQQAGAFKTALKAIDLLRRYLIEFQINTTVTQYNFRQLTEIFALAIQLGAVSFHPFFLVPVGRAKDIPEEQLSKYEYEGTLNKLSKLAKDSKISCRPTCAPHYFRVLNQSVSAVVEPGDSKKHVGLDGLTAGCLGGKSFAFISSTGKVQACGFLEVECGSIRQSRFSQIWQNSLVFNRLRDFSIYKGKCGECEYVRICGGCRARAYEATGDYLQEEPECVYQPLTVKS
ncbi:MAG: radical SAM protein [Candidatus Omnitrophica bacterium]|nr:radical SAM protein [Candidatus Omnitrophota bacterium]